MRWFHRHDESDGDVDDLVYPPSGGRAKLIGMGLVVAAACIGWGIRAWVLEEAVWFGGRGGSMQVRGATAKSVGACWVSAGCFAHFHWFWGLVPRPRVYLVGTRVSLVALAIAMGCSFYHLFS